VAISGCKMFRERGQDIPALIARAVRFPAQQRKPRARRLPPVVLQKLRNEPPSPGLIEPAISSPSCTKLSGWYAGRRSWALMMMTLVHRIASAVPQRQQS
jgi:hypothetical protein